MSPTIFSRGVGNLREFLCDALRHFFRLRATALALRGGFLSLPSNREVPKGFLSGFLGIFTFWRRRNFLSCSPLARQFDSQRLRLLFSCCHGHIPTETGATVILGAFYGAYLSARTIRLCYRKGRSNHCGDRTPAGMRRLP